MLLNALAILLDEPNEYSPQLFKPLEPSPKIVAFCEYLDLAGYLNPELITKAVKYLHQAKPFNTNPEVIIDELNKAVLSAHAQGKFNAIQFCQKFSKNLDDAELIDLIFFLQQTAFDRKFGVERDRLSGKPWMVEHREKFWKCAEILGMIKGSAVPEEDILGAGIMGGAYIRALPRILYLKNLNLTSVPVWALTGQRELSKGLDDGIAEELAAFLKVLPVQEVEKTVGEDRRIFFKDLTENQMVNYLIQRELPQPQIQLIDSLMGEEHWRATTAQNAKDIAPVIISLLKDKLKDHPELSGKPFHFIIIAESPHNKRMAIQVQRSINQELSKQALSNQIIVVGCGPELAPEEIELNQETINYLDLIEKPSKDSLSDELKPIAARAEKFLSLMSNINSALASLISECYTEVKIRHPLLLKRDPKILMFNSRDKTYESLIEDSKNQAHLSN